MLGRRTKICQDHLTSASKHTESAPYLHFLLVCLADTVIDRVFSQKLQCPLWLLNCGAVFTHAHLW